MTRHTHCHAGQQQPGLGQWVYRLPETDGAKVLPTSDQVGLYLASIHQMVPPEHTSDKQACLKLEYNLQNSLSLRSITFLGDMTEGHKIAAIRKEITLKVPSVE